MQAIIESEMKYGSAILPKEYGLDTILTGFYIKSSFDVIDLDTNEDIIEKYNFNLQRCITFENNIILGVLMEHELFDILSTSKLNKVYKSVVESANLEIMMLFYDNIQNIEDVVNKRLDFVETHITDHRLIHTPLYELIYDPETNIVSDPLIEVEDIIDNYHIFEDFTGISILQKDYLEKINKFLGNTLNQVDIKYIRTLHYFYKQKKEVIDDFLLNMTHEEYKQWRNYLITNNYNNINSYSLKEELIDKYLIYINQ